MFTNIEFKRIFSRHFTIENVVYDISKIYLYKITMIAKSIGKIIKKSIKMDNVYILCSTKLIQRICRQKKIDYENIIKNYTYQVGIHNEDNKTTDSFVGE